MNLNDFVVLPNNKAKSVKLNARNLQELQMKTVTLAQESKEMEEKLQQLKESMSKEKEERGHSGGFRWKSGQCGSLNSSSLTNSTKKNKENTLQKLSAGKVKIRLLKDEPLTVPPQPPPLPPSTHRTTRKNRLRGTICGQCEVRTAGLMCAECAEAYCVGCFSKFHQKGALKLHRMIPIQTNIQSHVSTQDVVSCFQKQMNPSSHPNTFTNQKLSTNSVPNQNHPISCNTITRRGDQKPGTGAEAMARHTQMHPDPSQMLVVNHGEEREVEMTVDGREDEKGFPASLLGGEYDEEDSARSFQEALRQWRGERSDGEGEAMTQEAMWITVRPVSVSAMATQADLPPDKGAEGRERGGGEGRVPVRVEFMENSLTYMDRLLLKKHRRTPTEIDHPSLAFGTDLKSLPNKDTEEETASSLTGLRPVSSSAAADSVTSPVHHNILSSAQEEDFHRYCASLFAVPVSRSRTEPQITTTEPCLIIEVLDETDVAEQRTYNNIKIPSVQQVSSKGKEQVPQTFLTSGGFSRVSLSPPSQTQPSRQSRASTQSKAPQKLHPSKPQTSPAEHSMKLPSSKSKLSAYPMAGTPRISKTSIKTSTSKSQKTSCSPTVNNSRPDSGSLQILSCPSSAHSQTEIPKFSYSSLSFHPDVSPLPSATSPTQEEHTTHSPSSSFPLRSTFTVSPSSSTESILLPKVYKSTPLQKGSPSPLLPEQSQSPQLFQETLLSLKLSQSSPSNLESPKQSQHSSCDPESLRLDNELQLPLSPVSSTLHPPPKSLEPRPPQTNPVLYRLPEKNPSNLSPLNQSPLDVHSSYRSIPTYEGSPSFMSSTPMAYDHESSLSCQDTHCPSHLLNAIHNPDKMEEEEELSIDSGDEMSSDSLGLAPHEEDFSDDEPKMHGCLVRGRSREQDQGNSAISHLEDPFVPADAERENDLQTDEPEQLSEPSMVMHSQRARSGSEQSCDLEEFLPLALDMNCGHSDTSEHTHYGPFQTSPHDSDQTGSLGYRPSSSLSTSTEEHLLFRMMKDNHTQQIGFQIHSTTPTGRGIFTANELGTSGSHLSGKSTPTPKTNTSPLPASIPPSLCHYSSPPLSACFPPKLGSEFGPVFRPLSRAAQEIMEICNVDQAGCEDPDLDIETSTHTLHDLEQEFRLMVKETGAQTLVVAMGNGGSQAQHGNLRFTRGRVSEEQKEEDEVSHSDRQSVLLLR